mmetsp:Transcript_104275/g.200178  ORF Transcript_104275/g.200178 Transcript_104275/m.200178 type:complete len:93 (-) Transcript_104275:376-654(-)
MLGGKTYLSSFLSFLLSFIVDKDFLDLIAKLMESGESKNYPTSSSKESLWTQTLQMLADLANATEEPAQTQAIWKAVNELRKVKGSCHRNFF